MAHLSAVCRGPDGLGNSLGPVLSLINTLPSSGVIHQRNILLLVLLNPVLDLVQGQWTLDYAGLVLFYLDNKGKTMFYENSRGSQKNIREAS